MKAAIVLDRDFAVGDVDPRLFGGFAEHLGRHIYGGIYEPGHPAADEQGFRRDVIELVRELGMPVVRYPGGNFVSGYRWEDGVGPIDQRPVRLDLAWKSTEPNTFGTDEFVDWCRKIGAAPMLAVNLGTRGPEEARALVEYCNHPSGTYWSDLRRRNGSARPHGVKLWCLGNEMDGPWQMGHKTAAEYGRIACETGKLMKWVDPGIELVACGSSGRGMATFGAWELEVLDHCFDQVDYVSLHTYIGNHDGDTARFLAQTEGMGRFIEETAALCDAAAAKRKSVRRLMLSFDEWNVWFHSHDDRRKRKIRDWAVAPPLLEDVYTMEDALAVGCMLIALLNHADRVRIACIAQIVNVIAPIMTVSGGPAWRQTIFHPFQHASRYGRGRVLRTLLDCPRYSTRDQADVPVLAAACVADPERGGLTVFAVNRSLSESMRLRLDLRAFGPLGCSEHVEMRHADLLAVNTVERPDTVRPKAVRRGRFEGSAFTTSLQPASWNVIRLAGR